MGVFRQNVKLINTADKLAAQSGYINKSNIRELDTAMLVDTGAYMLCINQKLKTNLGWLFRIHKRVFWQMVNAMYLI